MKYKLLKSDNGFRGARSEDELLGEYDSIKEAQDQLPYWTVWWGVEGHPDCFNGWASTAWPKEIPQYWIRPVVGL